MITSPQLVTFGSPSVVYDEGVSTAAAHALVSESLGCFHFVRFNDPIPRLLGPSLAAVRALLRTALASLYSGSLDGLDKFVETASRYSTMSCSAMK